MPIRYAVCPGGLSIPVTSLPDDAEPYQKTKEFTESTTPAGLLRRHNTKLGVWGRICVLEGKLLYRILEPDVEEILLLPGLDGVVEPGIYHEVEPQGSVRFFVEFCRQPS